MNCSLNFLPDKLIVSKEVGERDSNVNITPGNRNSDKGKENRRKSSFPEMGGENEMYTATAQLGETRTPTQRNSNSARCRR